MMSRRVSKCHPRTAHCSDGAPSPRSLSIDRGSSRAMGSLGSVGRVIKWIAVIAAYGAQDFFWSVEEGRDHIAVIAAYGAQDLFSGVSRKAVIISSM
jgi:hypothetical protein